MVRSFHLDARWARTVYRSEREKAYKPRYPDVPVPWVRTPDWKPETDEEIAERRKGWADGYRLSHKEALLGGIYRFFEDPERKVRIVHIFHDDKPTVQVFSLGHPVESKIIFADELHETQLNSRRARKNWCKRRAAWKRRALAESNICIHNKPWPPVGDKVHDPRA